MSRADAARRWAERSPTAAFQVAVWSLVLVLASVPLFFDAGGRGGSTAWLLAWAGFGVVITTAWARVLDRLPEALFRAPLALGMLPVSMVLAATWVATMWALEPWVGVEPSPPAVPGPQPFDLEPRYVLAMARNTVFLITWTGLYLATLFTRRMQVERERVLAAQALASSAQLQSLRSQLNPHFLFNALNSVVGLIAENPKGAQTMVRDLSGLLRAALGRTSNTGTLADELAFNELYLKCEKVRFEEKLSVEFRVQPGLELVETPTMLLQPLVENALKHGRAPANAPLSVLVEAREQGDRIEVRVQSPGTLRSGASTGLGVRSVSERLGTLYGARQSFSLSEADGFVTARLSWPLVRVRR
ncbi:MAG: histidine kinase [Myxococcaceae bacterium]|nr:histidine kinase [Myxococcaceae bacterium]